MTAISIPCNLFRPVLLSLATCLTLAISGCSLGPVIGQTSSSSTIAPAFSGTMHGGPNPVVGARVVIYSTTSAGYGVGSFLQEADANYPASSPIAHQDTDAYGVFHFSGGYTCPAGQFAYIVAYGGNAGAGNNPNSIFAAPIGPCDTLYTGTTYIGPTLWIDELTTVATAYALSNFLAVTGDAVNGYTVGIGAPATNNGTTGCVANAYYPSCTVTTAAGLKHAFANALALVSNTTGAVNAATGNGALIPSAEINSLGNIMQACVNSQGGGTDPSTGLPTTVTTSAGTSHDGTMCGKLFAFTSYTSNGLPTGALTAAGNTLDAIRNLAKRPTGSASNFDNACDSNSNTGTSSAVSCIFSLVSPISYYLPSLMTAPPDWMIGISYPKASLSTSATSGFTTSSGCAVNTTGNGLYYPEFVQTDINDDVIVLNGDTTTPVCSNIIAISTDGSPLGTSAIDNTTNAVATFALDAWGHAILPIHGANGIRFYQYDAAGTSDPNDTNVPYVLTVNSPATSGSTQTSAYKGYYAGVDGNSNVYISAINGTNDWGYLPPTVLSHTAPAYTTAQLGATTSALLNVTIDTNNNAFTTKSNLPIGTGSTGTNFTSGPSNGAATAFATLLADTSGNLWQVVNNGTTPGTSQTVVIKFAYTAAGGVVSWGAHTSANAPSYAFPVNTTNSLNDGLNSSVKFGVMDGNNVMWWADLSGVATAPPYGSFLRGYDTANNYGTSQLQGCKLTTSSTDAITAWTIGSTSTTFTTTSALPNVGAVLTFSGFSTSTFFNNVIATVVATSTSSSTFTISSTFGHAPGSATEVGSAVSRAGTSCGSNSGDYNYPSTVPYLLYQARGMSVDTMGNLWFANGIQGQVSEILGIAAPTWPTYVHNGTSNKP